MGAFNLPAIFDLVDDDFEHAQSNPPLDLPTLELHADPGDPLSPLVPKAYPFSVFLGTVQFGVRCRVWNPCSGSAGLPTGGSRKWRVS